jgi:hypothetical protein
MDAVKTTLFTMVSDIRYFMYAGFQNLPLSIAGIMIAIGCLTANYGMLFFSIGYLVLFPAILFAFNQIPFLNQITDAAACDLIPSTDFGNEIARKGNSQGIGYWIPMTFFFIGYIMMNAYSMYALPVVLPEKDIRDPNVSDMDESGKPIDVSKGLGNRTSNTGMAMVVITLLAILCIVVRNATCEGWLAILIGVLGGGFCGVGWYSFLKGVADHRVSDLFGMANRLLVPHALSNQPYACLPTDV